MFSGLILALILCFYFYDLGCQVYFFLFSTDWLRCNPHLAFQVYRPLSLQVTFRSTLSLFVRHPVHLLFHFEHFYWSLISHQAQTNVNFWAGNILLSLVSFLAELWTVSRFWWINQFLGSCWYVFYPGFPFLLKLCYCRMVKGALRKVFANLCFWLFLREICLCNLSFYVQFWICFQGDMNRVDHRLRSYRLSWKSYQL